MTVLTTSLIYRWCLFVELFVVLCAMAMRVLLAFPVVAVSAVVAFSGSAHVYKYFISGTMR